MEGAVEAVHEDAQPVVTGEGQGPAGDRSEREGRARGEAQPSGPVSPARAPGTSNRWSALLCCGIYAVLGILAYGSPRLILSNSVLVGGAGGDPATITWFLTAPIEAIVHGHHGIESFFFSPSLNYPYGANLANNTSTPVLGVLMAPVTLWVGPFAAFNLLCRLALILSACSMFLVLRRWVHSRMAAFLGGLLFGFSPFMVGQASAHPMTTFLVIPPILLLVLDEVLVRQEHGARRWGIGLGALCAIQYLISGEVLVVVGLTALAGVAVLVVLQPREAKKRLPHAVRALGWAAALGIPVIAYPVWFAAAGPGHIIGPPHMLADLVQNYPGDLLGTFFPWSGIIRIAPSAFFAIGSHLTRGGPSENGMYLGIPFVVVVGAFIAWFRRNRLLLFSGAMILVTYLLSLGPRLFIDGHDTGIRLPWTVAEHLPVLQDILAVHFDLMTQFFAAVALAVGLDQLIRWQGARSGSSRRHRRPARFGPAVTSGALAVAALVPLVPRLPIHSVPVTRSPVFTAPMVDRIPARSVLLTYPYPSPYSTEAQVDQIESGYRFEIPGGYEFVRGPNGRTNPGFQPYPLQPMTLIDLFMGAQRSEYPIPAFDTANLRRIRTYLVRYSISTLVVDRSDPGASVVTPYLVAVLGNAQTIGGLDVWFGVQRTLATRSVPSLP